MTWFIDAFSVVGQAAKTTLNVATSIVKPVLNAIISVTPGIASAARSLAVIPVIGQAAVTVAQAAMVVQSAATMARDLIVTAESFQARTFPAKQPTSAAFVPMPVPAMSVVTQPKRLPTPEELFVVLPQRQVAPTAPVFGGIVNSRAILPMPRRRPADKKYKNDLREILELLDDEPVEDATTSFANMSMGLP